MGGTASVLLEFAKEESVVCVRRKMYSHGIFFLCICFFGKRKIEIKRNMVYRKSVAKKIHQTAYFGKFKLVHFSPF